MSETIIIATRESRLTLWQAEHVKALLQAQGHAVDLLESQQFLVRVKSYLGGPIENALHKLPGKVVTVIDDTTVSAPKAALPTAA